MHIDYAGPFMGTCKMFLLVIDAYTIWLDVHVTSTSSSAITVELLRKSFSTCGITEVAVSDNAANFTSEEIQAFLKELSTFVCLLTIQPPTVLLSVQCMQTLKGGLRKMRVGSVKTKVSQFLFAY